MSLPAAQPPVILRIGNIQATQHHIMTPAGGWSAADVNVTSNDQTRTTTHIPVWAIVMCVIFIWFFLLSLLFLLARETRVSGTITITVAARNGQLYTENIGVFSATQRAEVMNDITRLQAIIGQERWRLSQH